MRSVRLAVVFVVLASAGCDKVLGLHEVDVPSVCPMLDPALDEDRDGQLNGADPCPTVAFEPADDEDMDGDLDACDLCPQTAADPGADPDCDGLGAACDPDSMVAHERRFYGFHSSVGFAFEDPAKDGTVDQSAGQLHFVLDMNNTTSTIYMDAPGTALASYEFAGVLKNAMVPLLHWNVTLEINDAAGHEYEVQLQKSASSDEMSVTIEDFETELARIQIGPVTTSQVSFVVRGEVTTEGITGNVTANGITHMLAAPAAIAPVVGPVRYGIYTYRDRPTVASSADILIDYFVYTAERP